MLLIEDVDEISQSHTFQALKFIIFFFIEEAIEKSLRHDCDFAEFHYLSNHFPEIESGPTQGIAEAGQHELILASDQE
jgi:hypothetical protein